MTAAERLDALLADRALGELDAQEERELTFLLRAAPERDEPSWDVTVAALDLAFAAQRGIDPLPRAIRERLERALEPPGAPPA